MKPIKDFTNKVIQSKWEFILPEILDSSVDLILTDPPYNVSTKNIHKGKGKYLRQDFGEWDKDFDPTLFITEAKRILKPNGQIYVFCGDGQIGTYHKLFNELFGFFKLLTIWRSNPCPSFRKKSYIPNAQYIVWGRQGDYTFNFLNQNEMHTCFQYQFEAGNEKTPHPNQKDIQVIKKLIAVSSNPRDIVLDCFGGSGTTAIGCIELKRNYIIIEELEKYVSITNQRINKSLRGIY